MKPLMHHASTPAVDEYAKQLIDGGVADKTIGELAAFARLLASSPRLAKMLADTNVSVDARHKLLTDLVGQKISSLSIDGVMQFIAGFQRSCPALVQCAVNALAHTIFAVAEREGKLEAVELGLHSFAASVEQSPELRDVLTNFATPDSAKEALVTDLLSGKVEASVLELVRVLIALDHGRDADKAAEELSRAAAARRNMIVADVLTAVPLETAQRERLTAALSQTMGKPVESRFSVDPSIIGSVIVRVGDEVFDGSLRHRLNQARQTMVGAS